MEAPSDPPYHGIRLFLNRHFHLPDDGVLFFHGRRDDQVKIAGHRIEPGDVEVHLASLPRVRQAAVVADCRNGHAESLHAFVVLSEAGEGSPLQIGASIRKELAVQIPTYMLPRKVHVVEQLPLTPNGKTDRRALAASLPAPSA